MIYVSKNKLLQPKAPLELGGAPIFKPRKGGGGGGGAFAPPAPPGHHATASKALALALTRVAEDLGQPVRVAIRVASLSRDTCPLLLPSNHTSPLLREYKPSPSGCIFHHWLHAYACGVGPSHHTQFGRV